MIGRAGVAAIGTGVPLLAKAVAEQDDATVRQAAAYALAKIPEHGPEALRGLLGHPNPQVRKFALTAYPVSASGSAQSVARLFWRIRHQRCVGPRSIGFRIPKGQHSSATLMVATHATASSMENLPPLLLTALPDSVLPHLLALSRDADAQMRAAAVAALGALGCAQPVLAPSVVNALVAKFSDPADTVVSEAVDQLAGLAQLRVAPRSDETLDRVLTRLADATARENMLSYSLSWNV